ncbi:hypothetical protein ARMGADRAFT_1013382 [Armillaria gallica]|uniref:Uncharacterized protein n=1 Tax=Armillaria gallica TaxID=47427 RepID=A0A2H3DDF0_ARMGA|nr:hypothetical protein ARMGADRAFT_1013382 [Armillaria gallica]
MYSLISSKSCRYHFRQSQDLIYGNLLFNDPPWRCQWRSNVEQKKHCRGFKASNDPYGIMAIHRCYNSAERLYSSYKYPFKDQSTVTSFISAAKNAQHGQGDLANVHDHRLHHHNGLNCRSLSSPSYAAVCPTNIAAVYLFVAQEDESPVPERDYPLLPGYLACGYL